LSKYSTDLHLPDPSSRCRLTKISVQMFLFVLVQEQLELKARSIPSDRQCCIPKTNSSAHVILRHTLGRHNAQSQTAGPLSGPTSSILRSKAVSPLSDRLSPDLGLAISSPCTRAHRTFDLSCRPFMQIAINGWSAIATSKCSVQSRRLQNHVPDPCARLEHSSAVSASIESWRYVPRRTMDVL